MTRLASRRRSQCKPFTGPQKHALKLAQRGPLRACRRGYRDAEGVIVSRATALVLIARGWLVVAATDGSGQPSCIEHVGAQIAFPFWIGAGEAPSPT